MFSSRDRVDHWWVKVFGLMSELNGERPSELMLLVKLSCTLAHNNAFLERGMGLTKRVVDGRSSLSDTSVKAVKVVKQMILQVGGVTKVPITTEMLMYVRLANQRYTREREEVKEAAKKKAKVDEEEAEAANKRKLEEESKKAWQEKKETLDKDIKSSLDFISSQEKIRKTWMDKALKMTNPATMKTAMMTAKFAAEAGESRAKDLDKKQVELAQLMGKKPRK